MRRAFRIHHEPEPGDVVQLVVDYLPKEMTLLGDGWWEGNADVDIDTPYYYRVVGADGSVRRIDHGRARKPLGESTIIDRWRVEDPTRLARHSAVFKQARGRLWPEEQGASGLRLTIRLHESAVPPGHRVAVYGSDPALGAWDEQRALPLTASPFPWWTVSTNLEQPDEAGEYRYLIINEAGKVVHREELHHLLPPCPSSTIVTDERLHGLPPWRGTGVAVPVFSLRTAESMGVGEFADLTPFAEWASRCGIDLIQILPINDTTNEHAWADSYPYDPISVHALHPLYLRIQDLPGAEDVADVVADHATELNAEPEVAYEEVMSAKLILLRQLFTGAPDHAEAEAWSARQWEWLGPYAAWSALRDAFKTSDMSLWGDYRDFEPSTVEAMRSEPEVRFWCWVQYHLHRQLEDAVEQVHRLGIALKGDLPIGVAPNSVETWTRPDLFHLGTQTGAPPDDFAVRGQNWGFPTYDWDAMAADDHRWWRDRFAAMSHYCDAYRIDHILGFFRIWEIPAHAIDGLLGWFRPCLPLSEEELHSALPKADIEWLTRPMIDVAVLERRFGPLHVSIRERCFTGPDGDLRFVDEFADQRAIAAASQAGTFDHLGDRAHITRHLLDLRADAPLMARDDGFAPRISWHATEAYQRLPGHEKEAFDHLANEFFYQRHNRQWQANGMQSLPPVVDATAMLPCGEDLGMVPDMVPTVMREMGILSLEIERMPKMMGAWRADPSVAPYLSVVSPATHDMAPIRLWWEEERAAAERYWSEAMGREGDAPMEATSEVCEAIVDAHLASPAMLTVVQLQDLLATVEGARRDDIITERINQPADRHHQWRYRCHLDVGDLPVRDWSRR
jgi:4-alpha-glucanotransferase